MRNLMQSSKVPAPGITLQGDAVVARNENAPVFGARIVAKGGLVTKGAFYEFSVLTGSRLNRNAVS